MTGTCSPLLGFGIRAACFLALSEATARLLWPGHLSSSALSQRALGSCFGTGLGCRGVGIPLLLRPSLWHGDSN